ncbi:hypothetical protein AHAS_Ahas05G0063300 [Arachis hypogaea]|uniref:GRF-type domain-containing protein n=1 Tax=Arachis hypogaea TaxID=3818 RepID=A0A445D950_ARAHY|nr:hypothetical protein Ahy_A05g025636 [Arachis hypogaea]
MVGSGERCASSNLRAGDSWSYSMNSNESIVGRRKKSIVGRRKKRWVSPKCCCGSYAVLFMSGTKSNPDRLFLRCPKFKTAEGCCLFFVWLDDYVSSFNDMFRRQHQRGYCRRTSIDLKALVMPWMTKWKS